MINPNSGRFGWFFPESCFNPRPCHPPPLLPTCSTIWSVRADCPAREARRIVEEVVSFYGETIEAFVTRRHRELQAEGLRNHMIYTRIAEELEGWRFQAPQLSERQIRRIVYG